jgi:hypothetical protein
MTRIYIIIALFSIVNTTLFAQSSSAYLPYPADVCAGANYNVTVYPSSFTNGVTINILLSNDNFATSTNIGSATYSGGYSQVISCVIPALTLAGTNYKVKADASGVLPANNFSSGTFSVATSTPSASLTGTISIQACGGTANLPVQIVGTGPFSYEYLRTGDFYASSGTTTSNSPTITVYQAGTYTLQNISNACGTGTISASPNNFATVSVTAPVLTIGTPSDDIVCIGNKIKVPFTSNQSCYDYKVQILDNTGDNFTNMTTEYDQFNLPGILIASIPNLSQTPGSGYKLRVKVQVNSDSYYSSPSSATLTLNAKPRINSVEILDPLDTNYPATIAKGENIKMSVGIEGIAPFVLKTGESIHSIPSGTTYNFQISPTADGRYLIGPLSDATGCVSEPNYYNDIEVKDYIFKNRILENNSLDIYTKFRIFCKNEYIHLDYNVRTAQHPDSILVQVAYYTDLQKGINDWTNAIFEKSGDNQLSIKIPNGLRKGRYSLRVVPKNPNHTYKSYDYTIINDDMIVTDFILMDPAIAEMPGEDEIVIAPNEPFYLFYKFNGGPDYYGNSLGSLKVYKPVLKTNKGQTIKYSSILGLGFNALTGTTKVDTITKSIIYKLAGVEASTAAAGDISCSSSQSITITDSLSVRVIPVDPSRSISTGVIANANNLCAGSTITVPFTTIGTFNPGNVFTVQLQEFPSSFATEPISNFISVSTTPGLNPNELIATLPVNAINSNNSYYAVRVISSNPGVIGSTSSTKIYVDKRPPYIELTGNAYVLAGEQAKIKVKNSSSYPYFNYKITNGPWESSIINSGSYSLSYFSDFLVETPPTSTVGSTINYTSTTASNACGNSVNLGQGTVNIVSSPKITITSPLPTSNCNPVKLSVQYISDLFFGLENTFSAKVWHNYYGSPSYVSNVEIKKTGNSLLIAFPSVYVPVNGTTYFVQVFSNEPYANSNIVSFTMNNSPSFYYSPTNVNVDLGDATNLTYTITGSPNFNFSLSTVDGEKSINTGLSNYVYNISPLFTKTYALSNLSDANCPTSLAPLGPLVTVIENKQKIEIKSFSKTSLCSGSSFNVPFLSDGTFSSFVLQLSDANGDNFVDISTSISGNTLTGTVPMSLPAGTNYRIRIKGTLTMGGTQYSLPNLFGLTVKGSVTASISGSDYLVKNSNFLSFIVPDKELKVDFTGIGPYSFQLSDGTNSTVINTNSNPHFIKVNPAVTTTYSISNVSNECGVGTTSGNATINVVQLTAGIFSNDVCYGQVLSVPFTQVGTFSPSNQFFLDFQFIRPYNNTLAFSYNFRSLPATVSGNNLLVTIPNDFPLANGTFLISNSSYFKIRVRSTAPVALGSWGTGNLGVYPGAPSVKILGSTNITTPGTFTSLSLVGSNVAGYTTVDYTINGVGPNSLSFYGNELAFSVNPSVTTTYTLTSIYSACGAGTLANPVTATITVGPCPVNQSMSLNLEPGTTRKFETSGILDAINTVKTGANIQYDAQRSIILNPGFKVENGAIFKAYIDGCGGL